MQAEAFSSKNSCICPRSYEYYYLPHSKGYHPINLVRTKGIKSFSSVVKLNIYPGSISIPEQFLCRGNTISRYLGGPLDGDIGKYLAYITFIGWRRRVHVLILSAIWALFNVPKCNPMSTEARYSTCYRDCYVSHYVCDNSLRILFADVPFF